MRSSSPMFHNRLDMVNMSKRDTRTGRLLERMVLPAIRQGGYSWTGRKCVGKKVGFKSAGKGGNYFVSGIAEKGGKKFLVSLRWQQVSGTAEQKVPYEVMCLADALKQGDYEKAYLVLGGPGWKLRDFYVSGGLKEHMKNIEKVEILKLEDFLAKCNRGEL